MATPNNTSPSQNNEQASDESQASLALWIKNNKGMLEIFLDAYCIVDAANRVVEFNTAFTELCGESYRRILKVGHFCDLFKTETCPHQCPSKQIMNSKAALRLDELKASSKAFPQLNVILGGVPIFSDHGSVVGCLVTVRNVSAETELQKKYDERKEDAVTDGLTRIFNKTYTENSLLRLMKSSLRETRALTVAMCDVDFFKKVNDGFGHQAGDYVLSTMANLLKEETRDTDIVGRFGGEEFIVILGNTDDKGAIIFCERFRKRVASTPIQFDGKNIPITVSIGTATFSEIWKPGVNPERAMKDLINRADTALYHSKANGRNRTTQFENLPQDTQVFKKTG